MPTLSLLLSIFSGRTEQLALSLGSLTSFPYNPQCVELRAFIDCVDNIETLQILKQYRAYFSHITVYAATYKRTLVNHSASRRNFLAKAATGDYVIFSEPEMFHLDNTIQHFLNHAKTKKQKEWVSGPVYASDDVTNRNGAFIDNEKPLKNLRYIMRLATKKHAEWDSDFNKYYRLIDNKFYNTPYYCTMFHRQNFLRLGGLNQNLKVRGFEEVEFYNRFIQDGGKVIIDTSIKTVHLPHPRSLNKESQISWNLYNSTVLFDPKQKIGVIKDASFKMIHII